VRPETGLIEILLMSHRLNRLRATAILVALVSPLTAAQTPPRDSAKEPARDPRAASQRTAKGPLPDPVLLDGSKFEAEKRPEYGMLGEFEMPGDEKKKSDKVGGTGAEQKKGPGQSGGGGEKGAPGGQAPGAEATAAGANANGQNNAAPGTAEGTKVSEIKGGAQPGQPGQTGGKPQQVAIGDSTMQIKPQPDIPGLVGAQPVGKEIPQQYDKNTPGGKQTPGRGNQGVEKGRVMPAGI
jgi:hypothetical protein